MPPWGKPPDCFTIASWMTRESSERPLRTQVRVTVSLAEVTVSEAARATDVPVAAAAARTGPHSTRRTKRRRIDLYGPATTMSTRSESVAATAAARVTVSEPPPAGTVPDAADDDWSLASVSDTVAVAQAAAI